jgi:hypothetical protein
MPPKRRAAEAGLDDGGEGGSNGGRRGNQAAAAKRPAAKRAVKKPAKEKRCSPNGTTVRCEMWGKLGRICAGRPILQPWPAVGGWGSHMTRAGTRPPIMDVMPWSHECKAGVQPPSSLSMPSSCAAPMLPLPGGLERPPQRCWTASNARCQVRRGGPRPGLGRDRTLASRCPSYATAAAAHGAGAPKPLASPQTSLPRWPPTRCLPPCARLRPPHVLDINAAAAATGRAGRAGRGIYSARGNRQRCGGGRSRAMLRKGGVAASAASGCGHCGLGGSTTLKQFDWEGHMPLSSHVMTTDVPSFVRAPPMP